MKVIKRFNDGTALVQRGNDQPEIIKMEDIKEEDRTCKVAIVALDGDGFVIEGTDFQITISPKTKLHVKLETQEDQLHGTVIGEQLLEYLQNLQKILTTSTIARPSK